MTKWQKRVYRLLLDKCMQFFAMSYLYWLIYEQSHFYNQKMSSFCMYTAPKSLQKTPVWIIMRTLLLDISNKKKSKTKNRAHRFAAVLLQLHLKLGVTVHSANFCIIFGFFSVIWPNITNTSNNWVM